LQVLVSERRARFLLLLLLLLLRLQFQNPSATCRALCGCVLHEVKRGHSEIVLETHSHELGLRLFAQHQQRQQQRPRAAAPASQTVSMRST